MSGAKEKVQQIIDDHGVAVFSKSFCPFCQQTKELLKMVGAKYFVMELDRVDDRMEILDALQEISGQRTLPNIFINHKHIGGNSELQGKKRQLKYLLREAGAL